MKKIGFLVLVLTALSIPFLIQSRDSERPILLAQSQGQAQNRGGDEDESQFWSAFRRVFSRPDPSWSKSSGQVSTTAGVRGVDEEGKLKESYDFGAVKWMEGFKVNENEMMEFLKSRGLGPYRGRAVKGEE